MIRYFLTTLIFFLPMFDCYSQTPPYKNEFGFKTENDAYLAIKQDQYYTNGLFLSFRSAIRPSANQDTAKLVKKIWGVNAGQKMYNAYSGYVPNRNRIDRPFAAYLYASTSFQWLYKNENIFRIEIQGGTIGPSAKGKEGQELYHKLFNFYELEGWDYQIKDEASINVLFNFERLMYRSNSRKLDVVLPFEARIGNTFSGIKAGMLLRTGNLNPLYHSSTTNSNVATYKETGVIDKELFFFLKPSLDFVLYDATVSGGLFREDKGDITFGTKPIVFSQEIGVGYSQKRWTLNFSLIFKSKEVKSVAKAHQYGIIDVFYRFN